MVWGSGNRCLACQGGSLGQRAAGLEGSERNMGSQGLQGKLKTSSLALPSSPNFSTWTQLRTCLWLQQPFPKAQHSRCSTPSRSLSPKHLLFLGAELHVAREDSSRAQALRGSAVSPFLSLWDRTSQLHRSLRQLYTDVHTHWHGDRPTLSVLETSPSIAALLPIKG